MPFHEFEAEAGEKQQFSNFKDRSFALAVKNSLGTIFYDGGFDLDFVSLSTGPRVGHSQVRFLFTTSFRCQLALVSICVAVSATHRLEK